MHDSVLELGDLEESSFEIPTTCLQPSLLQAFMSHVPLQLLLQMFDLLLAVCQLRPELLFSFLRQQQLLSVALFDGDQVTAESLQLSCCRRIMSAWLGRRRRRRDLGSSRT